MDDEAPESELERLAREGSLEALRQLVLDDPDFDAASGTAESALRSAVECGHWDCLSLLVRHANVQVWSVDTGGVSLQHAAVAGRLDILQMLVEAGAQLTGKVGSNVLLSSASTGRLDIVKYAAAHGADVASGGGEAAWGAAKASFWGIARYLVEAGADMLLDGVGARLLAFAAVREQQGMVELLEGRGVSVQSDAGVTALAYVASTWQWDAFSDVARYLIANGVDLNSEAGDIALVTAAQHGDLDMVQCIAKGMDMKSKAAGEAIERAGELGSIEGKNAVVSYLTSLGAIAPTPPALILDADF